MSQGLARRLDAAYLLTAVATTLGIVTALLKGVDYETAVGLTLLLLLLWRARPAFDRRAALFDTRFPIGWALAVAGAVGASIWLGSFVFQHVEYSNQLWWQFELHSDVSRFLRASVGSAVFVLLFAVGRLFGPAPHVLDEPTPDDLQAAAAIVDRQRYAHPNLVFLKDKALLFDEARTAFVMYGIQGRTWVALGDPAVDFFVLESGRVEFLLGRGEKKDPSGFMLKMSSSSFFGSPRSAGGVVREELKMIRDPSADQCGCELSVPSVVSRRISPPSAFMR